MPIVLRYFAKRYIWIFTFLPRDVLENRAHVHAGKINTDKMCKIWLEPEIEVAKQGSLTISEINTIIETTEKHRNELMEQWKNFKAGKKTQIIIVYEN